MPTIYIAYTILYLYVKVKEIRRKGTVNDDDDDNDGYITE